MNRFLLYSLLPFLLFVLSSCYSFGWGTDNTEESAEQMYSENCQSFESLVENHPKIKEYLLSQEYLLLPGGVCAGKAMRFSDAALKGHIEKEMAHKKIHPNDIKRTQQFMQSQQDHQ